MKIEIKDPPRKFSVGTQKKLEISDCGKVRLEPGEQVTFVTASGREYDVAAKSWGFYATPSVNGRLKQQGFKSALVRNPEGRYYIMLVESEKVQEFQTYLASEKAVLEEWLDER